jgi:dTDP-4-amino-4,6-dideoxygalactose transaminase
VFAESVGETDLNMDPADVRKKITPRTKAIMAVHFAGFPAHIDELVKIAAEHNLILVEDCAHALVTKWNGKALGTFGRCGAFSFFSNKNMTCGEGGMATTDDDETAGRIKLLRSHGMTALSLDRHAGRVWSYDCLETGWNMRIDEIRARLASVQLRRLPDFLERREALRGWYVEALKNVPVAVPFAPFTPGPGTSIGWHVLPVVLPKGTDRESVMEALKKDRIQSSIHYPPAHLFTAVQEENHPALPVTEDLAARELTLPFYPAMTREDVGLVCGSLGTALR